MDALPRLFGVVGLAREPPAIEQDRGPGGAEPALRLNGGGARADHRRRDQHAKKLDSQIADIEQKIAEREQAMEGTDQLIKELRDRDTRKDSDLSQARSALATMEEQLGSARGRVSDLEDRAQRLDREPRLPEVAVLGRDPVEPERGGGRERVQQDVRHRDLVERGAQQVAVVPMLLLAAGHAKRDIPATIQELSAEFPDTSLTLCRHVGEHEAIVDAEVWQQVQAMRSRSRSRTRRIATDWTRQAERALSTARHSTGDTS